eukprot:5119690-Amphidinium_carterae.1
MANRGEPKFVIFVSFTVNFEFWGQKRGLSKAGTAMHPHPVPPACQAKPNQNKGAMTPDDCA